MVKKTKTIPAQKTGGIFGLLRKPFFWILGIVGGVLTTVITGLVTDLATPITRQASEFWCNAWRRPLAPDDNRFTVLVARLSGDQKGRQTEHLIRGFHGLGGIRVAPICETIEIDTSQVLDVAMAEAVRRAGSIVTRESADLILFGDVRAQDKSLHLWAVNEIGGCDPKPREVTIKDGLIDKGLQPETKSLLIKVSLQEIASACRNDKAENVPIFERRVLKLEKFLESLAGTLSKEELDEVSDSYYVALYVLYSQTSDIRWFNKANQLIEQHLKNTTKSSEFEAQWYYWFRRASMYRLKSWRTNLDEDRTETITAYTKVIEMSELPASLYVFRASFYREVGQIERSREDLDTAIKLDPKEISAYKERGFTNFVRGDFAGAAVDFAHYFRNEQSTLNTYAVLHSYLSQNRLRDETAASALKANSSRLDSQKWPYPIIEMFLNLRTPSSAHEMANSSDNKCEASFYIGQLHRMRNELNEFVRLMQQTTETCPKYFFEYHAAATELRRLKLN